MFRYEIKIAKGTSLESLEADINRIANLRAVEERDLMNRGYEVSGSCDNWFKPVSPISFDGKYLTVLMMRVRPH